jgi:hypothetical protein
VWAGGATRAVGAGAIGFWKNGRCLVCVFFCNFCNAKVIIRISVVYSITKKLQKLQNYKNALPLELGGASITKMWRGITKIEIVFVI